MTIWGGDGASLGPFARFHESGFSSKIEPIMYMHACVCDTDIERLILRDWLTRWWRLPCPKSAGQADNLWTLLAASDEGLWVLREGSLGRWCEPKEVTAKRTEHPPDRGSACGEERGWTERTGGSIMDGVLAGAKVGVGGLSMQWTRYNGDSGPPMWKDSWGPGACCMAKLPSAVPPSRLFLCSRGWDVWVLLLGSSGFGIWSTDPHHRQLHVPFQPPWQGLLASRLPSPSLPLGQTDRKPSQPELRAPWPTEPGWPSPLKFPQSPDPDLEALPFLCVQPKWSENDSESRSVVFDSLWPHGLYSPWDFPGQDTGVGILSLTSKDLPTQESNWGILHCRQILY